MQQHETDEWQVAHFVGRQVSDKVIILPGVFLHIWDAQFNKARTFRALHMKTSVYFSSWCRDFLKIRTWDTTHAHYKLYKFGCTQYIIKDTVCNDQFIYLYLGCHLGIVLKMCILDTFTFSQQVMQVWL